MTVNDMSEERQQSYINELKRCVKEDCDFYLEHNETYEFNNYINQLQQENQKYKKVIDKTIKCIDYNTKYRNGADIYQFVDIESEILEPLKYILELDEKNGNAYLKEFNDWLKGVE